MSIVKLSFLSLTHAYFSMRVQLQRSLNIGGVRIFLATPTKDADIDTTNQNIEKA